MSTLKQVSLFTVFKSIAWIMFLPTGLKYLAAFHSKVCNFQKFNSVLFFQVVAGQPLADAYKNEVRSL